MYSKIIDKLIGAILFISILAACSTSIPVQPTATRPIYPPTGISQANGTPTAITATPAPPNPTSEGPGGPLATVPPVPPYDVPESLTMPAGATSISVSSNVATDGHTSFLVQAASGQFMMATINSASASLYLQITAPDKSLLVSSSQKLAYWQGNLPAGGNYVITVFNKGQASTFNLSITIPVRVTFQPGAISATLNGQIGAHQINTYLLRAMQGQTLSVTVTSPKKDIFLTIYGLQDGQPYARSVTGDNQANFILPSSQDYVIQCVSLDEAPQTYTVEFVVK